MATQKLPRSPGHPFYERLNQVLEKAGFDAFVETLCARFYADGIGQPSLRPGRYFRMLLVGYFEGLNSERAIAWRVADSMSLRAFLDLDPEETPPKRERSESSRCRCMRIGAGFEVAGDDGCSGGGASWWSGRSRPKRTTGGLRRIFVRGHANVRKRLLIHVCGFNLGLLMRRLTGIGTPRSLQGRVLARLFFAFWGENGPLERLESAQGALLGVDRARTAVSGFPDPSINASPRQIAERTIVG